MYKALNYVIRHYEELTAYLDIPEMPWIILGRPKLNQQTFIYKHMVNTLLIATSIGKGKGHYAGAARKIWGTFIWWITE
jgi:hypothetical protein